uniref:Reverse transcriptase domain-containing protein n=1 Tax=Tanacetum cinerariifolium TaxID=118510 RepID=A0A6L2MCT5_TANCI|nr:hypothetical protein [Tanacetum cinerariifolium]
MPILHSFEENKIEYEDEDAVEIKMMGTRMDKESLEYNLYENDITLIIFHNFSPTSNPPIKPKDSVSFRMKVVEPLTIHTPPSPHVAYLYRNGARGVEVRLTVVIVGIVPILDGDDDDDNYDKESIISTNTDIFETPPSIVITTSHPVLPIEDPESSVGDLVPIPCESEDTSGSERVCILPSCDDFSPIDVLEEKAVTYSNPFFNSNKDFISSDDESLSDEDVPEDNVKIYSNPLFKFDDEYISSDVNPLFYEVLGNIESKDSYDSNIDEPDLLVTLLSDANKNECFDSGGDDDEINVMDCEDNYYDSEGDILYLESLLNDDLVHYDPSIPAMSVASILEGFIDEPPLKEYDELFDLEPKNDEWKKILYDAPILMTEIAPYLEVSRACGFVHRPLELQSFEYGNPIS